MARSRPVKLRDLMRTVSNCLAYHSNDKDHQFVLPSQFLILELSSGVVGTLYRISGPDQFDLGYKIGNPHIRTKLPLKQHHLNSTIQTIFSHHQVKTSKNHVFKHRSLTPRHRIRALIRNSNRHRCNRQTFRPLRLRNSNVLPLPPKPSLVYPGHKHHYFFPL